MIATSAIFERFVGRRRELDYLVEAFARGKAGGAGAAVLIGGESGIGKSRLLREFEQHVQRERCTVLRGSCLEYIATPYQPFIEALANERNAAQLEQALRGQSTERAANAEDERVRRFRFIEDHLRRRAATTGSLVLLLEDLQWSDAATVDLLRYLVRRLTDAPVLMVATYRSDDLEADHARMALLARLAREGAVQIVLERLDDREIRSLLHSAVAQSESIEPSELDRIAELSEGRPLVAEELLRGALERAHRPGARGQETPPSIRATVLERLHACDEAGQQLMLHAAVVGREFDVDLLMRLTDMPDTAILQTLRRARGLQLIAEGAAAGHFRFRHAITREILYHELLRSEARILHERIASVLDREGDVRVDEAAYHWWAAEDAGRAVPANEAAGDRAAAIYAYGDAARSYERAMLFAKDDARVRIVEKLAFALCAVGEMSRARRWCEDAAKELRRAGRHEGANRLLLWVSRQLYEAGEVARALETVEAVRDDLRDDASPVRYAADMTLAGIFATLGRSQEALAVLDVADPERCEHDPIDEFRYRNARGNALCSLGSFAEALVQYGKALAIAEALDNVELRLHAMGNAGNAALLFGDVARGSASYETALELARRHGLARHAVMLLSGAAFAALHRGDLDRARRAYDELASSPSGAAMIVGFAQAIGIRLFDLILDVERRVDVDSAVEAAFRLRESQVIAVVSGAAALSALEQGDARRAADLVERALAAITEPDHAYWLCEAAGAVGSDTAAAAARELLVRACADGTNRAACAHLDLFDARRAAGAGEQARAAELAVRATEAFVSLPWPLEAARALEVAGDAPGALLLYERHGATRAARRVAANAGARVAATRPDALTKREAQVAELAARGYISRQIGDELGIGERTVETHIATVYRKLGVKTRVELAARLRAVLDERVSRG